MKKNLLKTMVIAASVVLATSADAQSFAHWYGSSFGGDQGYTVKGLSNGNTIIGGHFTGNNRYQMAVVSTDPTGKMLWSKTFTDPNQSISSGDSRTDGLAILSDGSIIAAGSLYHENFGMLKGALIKLSAAGDTVWSRSIDITGVTGYGEVIINSIVTESNDDVTVLGVCGSGLFIARYSSNGTKISEKYFENVSGNWITLTDFIKTSDNGYMLCGFRSTGSLATQMVLIKLDAAYNVSWAKFYKSSGGNGSGLHSVVETVTGDFIAVGNRGLTEQQNTQMTILKVNSVGDTLWAKNYGDTTYINSLNKIIKSGNTYVVSGFGTNNANTTNGSSFNGVLFSITEDGILLGTTWFKPNVGMVQLSSIDLVGNNLHITGSIGGNQGYADILGIRTDNFLSDLCGVTPTALSVSPLVLDSVGTITPNSPSASLSADFIPLSIKVGAIGEEKDICKNTPSATSPAAPTNLQASPGKTESAIVNLTWIDNADNETGFKIERGTDGTTFFEIANVGVDVQAYNDALVSEGTTYYYRVLAFNLNGVSAFSNVVQATTSSSVGIYETANALSFNVFPNPANNVVTITNIPEGSTINITDITGKTVHRVTAAHSQVITSIDGLLNGIYFVYVESKMGSSIKKLIINH